MTYKDDPRWQDAHERLVSSDDQSLTVDQRLMQAVAAAFELRAIEREHAEKAGVL